MKKPAILLLLIPMFSSCTTMIFVNKPVPPEIEVQEKDQKIVIQNFFDYTKSASVNDKQREVFHSGISSFTNGLVRFFSGSDHFSTIIGDTLVSGGPGKASSNVPDPGYANSVCQKNNASLLLAIDSLTIGFDWETETIEHDDGSKEKTKYFYLQMQPFLSLYDHTGKLIDRSSVPVQEVYSARPALSGLITIRPSMNSKKAKKEVISLAGKAANAYGAKFFERMVPFPYRVYYAKPFNEAYRMMQTGNWNGAVQALLLLASSPDPKIAKRATHNLYVAYTALGDNAAAETWLERAK